MLLRDRLLARLAEMGAAPDHQRLAAEVLGIRNAPPELARRLVAQALVVEDRRDAWRRAGERIAANAPAGPGVYVLRDETARAVYVGKANNLRRRLRAHFAERRWRGLKAPFARIAGAEWHEVGSEIEALLREASLIEELRPAANVQVARAEPRDARDSGAARSRRDRRRAVGGSGVRRAGRRARGWRMAAPADAARRQPAEDPHATLLTRFFRSPLRDRFESPRLAPIVFSWLAGRGASASRIDPHDAPTVAATARPPAARCWRTTTCLPSESLC